MLVHVVDVDYVVAYRMQDGPAAEVAVRRAAPVLLDAVHLALAEGELAHLDQRVAALGHDVLGGWNQILGSCSV